MYDQRNVMFYFYAVDHRVLRALAAGLPPAESTVLVVLAADRNYVSAMRGSPRFNPSGEVGVSSVVGDGVGVFGSVVPVVIRSSAAPGSSTPPCPSAPLGPRSSRAGAGSTPAPERRP